MMNSLQAELVLTGRFISPRNPFLTLSESRYGAMMTPMLPRGLRLRIFLIWVATVFKSFCDSRPSLVRSATATKGALSAEHLAMNFREPAQCKGALNNCQTVTQKHTMTQAGAVLIAVAISASVPVTCLHHLSIVFSISVAPKEFLSLKNLGLLRV